MNSQTPTSHYKLFWQQFRQNFFQVGAVLPSSRSLARAGAAYLAQKQGPVRVLEAGAGTGAFTREIVPLLQAGDRLDIVEINSELMAYLQQRFQHEAPFQAPGVNIRFINDDIRNIPRGQLYDYIVFSLPLTNFPPALVEEILDLMIQQLKPGGVFSYVKYIFIGQVKYMLAGPATKVAMRANQAIINAFAAQYQLERRAVWLNVPPAWAYYWQKPVRHE